MGKAKEPYWTYVKTIIKEYLDLKKKLAIPLEQRVTSFIGLDGGKNGLISDPTQACVIHDLPPREQRKLEAIEGAIQKTKKQHPEDAELRLKVISLVYWKKSHTIEGAAMKVPCHRNVAGNWQGEFIRLVADELDLV